MYAQGYRPRGPDRHKTVIRFLRATLDPSFKPKLNRLDRIRKKRHRAVYRIAGTISEREAKGTIEFAEEFVAQLADLIVRENPGLYDYVTDFDADSVDHGFPAEAAPMPPVRGRGSPLCFKIVIYRD